MKRVAFRPSLILSLCLALILSLISIGEIANTRAWWFSCKVNRQDGTFCQFDAGCNGEYASYAGCSVQCYVSDPHDPNIIRPAGSASCGESVSPGPGPILP